MEVIWDGSYIGVPMLHIRASWRNELMIHRWMKSVRLINHSYPFASSKILQHLSAYEKSRNRNISCYQDIPTALGTQEKVTLQPSHLHKQARGYGWMQTFNWLVNGIIAKGHWSTDSIDANHVHDWTAGNHNERNLLRRITFPSDALRSWSQTVGPP
jgi:hypothetical protein